MGKFITSSGVSVTDFNGIHECYEVIKRDNYYSLAVNCSSFKIKKLLKSFCEYLEEPCFFILEVPTNFKIEEKIGHGNNPSLHCDVYFLDNCTKGVLLKILDNYGEILLNDGLSAFGFASHKRKNEIYVGQYKIINIFTADINKIKQMLNTYAIPEETSIKTVWDNFTDEAPGELSSIEISGKTIYDVVDELKPQGLYFAERRERY